jgi:hypothetical protein
MAKLRFSLAAYKDPAIVELVSTTAQQVLAIWAIDCVERVLPLFEVTHPSDRRPRHALDTLQTWITTGAFRMAAIRDASLASHAAARAVGHETAAQSVARAAGQAVATAHVPLHALGAATYALQALYRASGPSEAATVLAQERAWQIQHLRELRTSRPENGSPAQRGEEQAE